MVLASLGSYMGTPALQTHRAEERPRSHFDNARINMRSTSGSGKCVASYQRNKAWVKPCVNYAVGRGMSLCAVWVVARRGWVVFGAMAKHSTGTDGINVTHTRPL
jgi:hypothetical protein